MVNPCPEHIRSGGYALGIYLAYLGRSGLSLDMFWTCVGHVWDMLGVCVSFVLDMFGICLEHVLILQCYDTVISECYDILVFPS